MPYKDKQKQREWQNTWMQARRKAWIEENGPCVSCGSIDDLQVDHINAHDKVTHRVWSWCKEKREAELLKCQVLCLTCHLEKTKNRREHARGEQNGRSMLTYSQVEEIKNRLLEHESAVSIASDYSVTKWAIFKIKEGSTWISTGN